MKIIKDADSGILRLWGKQTAKPTNYRLMKYLIHETVEGNEILYNNITSELVLLSDEEAELIKAESIPYSEGLLELVEHHFLVPINYDELNTVTVFRKVLKAAQPKSKHITNYTILPTTACNARCYYCFEKGSKIETMTEQTADDVVEFIRKHCGSEKVQLDWFGGEPTVAHKRISQICRGLSNYGINFSSNMITNGYLFDGDLVNEAVDVWKLDFVRFSFDGSQDNYNRIKNYVSACDNPYEKVIQAVGLFLKRKIHVGVRMNFDIDTADDFEILLSDLYTKYGADEHLSVYTYPVHGEHINQNGIINHGTDEWFTETQIRMDDIAIKQGLYKRNDTLPCLISGGCMADNPECIVITPEGSLTRCSSKYEPEDFIGNIYDGITNHEKYDSWEIVGLPDLCSDCKFIPMCVLHPKCPGFGECYHLYRNQRIINKIKNMVTEEEAISNE